MARARKEEVIKEPEDQATDVAGLIAFLNELRAGIPEEERAKVPDDILENLDHYLYGSPKD